MAGSRRRTSACDAPRAYRRRPAGEKSAHLSAAAFAAPRGDAAALAATHAPPGCEAASSGAGRSAGAGRASRQTRGGRSELAAPAHDGARGGERGMPRAGSSRAAGVAAPALGRHGDDGGRRRTAGGGAAEEGLALVRAENATGFKGVYLTVSRQQAVRRRASLTRGWPSRRAAQAAAPAAGQFATARRARRRARRRRRGGADRRALPRGLEGVAAALGRGEVDHRASTRPLAETMTAAEAHAAAEAEDGA